MAGFDDLSAEFDINEAKIIEQASSLLNQQKSKQIEAVKEIEGIERDSSERIIKESEEKALASFEKRKKELEELYRLNEESFRKKTENEDRYGFNKIALQNKIDEINRQIDVEKGGVSTEGISTKVTAEPSEKRSEEMKLEDEDRFQSWLKMNQLDFQDKKEKIKQIKEENLREYKDGKLTEQEYERNSRIMIKQLKSTERQEDESFISETQKKVQDGAKDLQGIYKNLAGIFGIGLTGFGIYELISNLKIAVEEIKTIEKGIQNIAAMGGRSIAELGDKERSQLQAWIIEIRDFSHLSFQDITSMMARLRSGGRIGLEDVGQLTSEAIQASIITGMEKTRVADIYADLVQKFDIPASKLTSAFGDMYESAVKARRPMEDYIKDVSSASQELRRYGFSHEIAMGLVSEFSDELRKGILTAQDLVAVQLEQRKMTEGQRAFIGEMFLQAGRPAAEATGQGALYDFLEMARRKEGPAGMQELLKIFSEKPRTEGEAVGAAKMMGIEPGSEYYEGFIELAKKGGKIMVEPMIENILKAQGVTREETPGLYRMEFEKLYQTMTGVKIEDKMLEAGDKMMKAADRQVTAAAGFEKAGPGFIEGAKAIAESQHTIWSNISIKLGDFFRDMTQAVSDIISGKVTIRDIIKEEFKQIGDVVTGKSALIPMPSPTGGLTLGIVPLPEKGALPGAVIPGSPPGLPERKEEVERKVSPGVSRSGVRTSIWSPGQLQEPVVNPTPDTLSKVDIGNINVDLKLNILDKDKDYVKVEDLERLRREINEEISRSRRFK